MTFLPIVERELRVATRRSGTYRVRWVMAGLSLLLCVVTLLQGGLRFFPGLGLLLLTLMGISFYVFPLLQFRKMSEAGQRVLFVPAALFCLWFFVALILPMASQGAGPVDGSELFRTLSFCAFVYCLLAGAFATADSLSREKREGTLGFLFLSRLKGYDVVLGKLAATSLSALCGMLAVFPVLAIAFVLGGVTAGEFWRMVLALINTLCCSLACGMLVSTMLRGEREVFVVSVGLSLFLAAGLPWIHVAAQSANTTGTSVDGLVLLSPFAAYQLAFDAVHTTWTGSFLLAFAAGQSLSWLLLALACWLLPRVWRGSEKNVIGVANGLRRASTTAGNVVVRTRWLDRMPVGWLVARNRWLRASFRLAALAGVAVSLSWWALMGGSIDLDFPFFCLVVGLHLPLKLCVVWEVCRLVTGKWKDELLMVGATRLTEEELVAGLTEGIRYHLTGPVLVLLAMDVFLLVPAAARIGTGPYPGGAVFVLGQMALLVPDLCAQSWLALAQRLMRRTLLQAAGTVLGFLLAASATGYFIILMFVQGLPLNFVGWVVGAGFTAFLLIDLWIITDARWKAERACGDMLGRVPLSELSLVAEVSASVASAPGASLRRSSPRPSMPPSFYSQFRRCTDSE